jgi:hypothetical protein
VIIYRPRPYRVKPAIHGQINFGHLWAKGLLRFWALNAQVGPQFDCAGGLQIVTGIGPTAFGPDGVCGQWAYGSNTLLTGLDPLAPPAYTLMARANCTKDGTGCGIYSTYITNNISFGWDNFNYTLSFKNITTYNTPNNTLFPNGWRTLTATYDGATLSLYIYGQTPTTFTGLSIPWISDNYQIGYYYGGFISWIALWDYAMNATQVAQLAAPANAPSPIWAIIQPQRGLSRFQGAVPVVGGPTIGFPTVVINSSTGSDTLSSGAGPVTAINGTAAATHANTTVNITDAVDLSGVSTAGGAVLWIASSSGQQFAAITAISGSSGAWVVTVGHAFANTESGKSWAIGGKRATLAGSAQVLQDWQLEWKVDQQTGESISSPIVITAPSPSGSAAAPTLTSTTFTTWGTQPLIQTATKSQVMFKFGTNATIIKNLAFKSTAATPATCFQAFGATGTSPVWQSCIFDGFLMAIDGSNGAQNDYRNAIVENCEVKNCTGAHGVPNNQSGAISLTSGSTAGIGVISNCYLHGNSCAIYGNNLMVESCVIANNSDSVAVSIASNTSPAPTTVVRKNSFYANGTTGTDAGAVQFRGTCPLIHENNIYYGNTGYGFAITGGNLPFSMINRKNAYGNNNGGGTGLDRDRLPAGDGDITLTANPWVSTSTPDWGLNSTAGGGASCKAVAIGVPNATVNPAGDLGAIPSGGGATGGGGATYPILGRSIIQGR